MHASFPVYRRGMLLGATTEVSSQTADAIVDRIMAASSTYVSNFVEATRAVGARTHRRATKEGVRRTPPSKRVLLFPGVDLSVGSFRIKSRSSLTVCVGRRRSKIWNRLTCAKIRGRAADNLNADETARYFRHARTVSRAALEGLLSTYRNFIEEAGLELREEPPYSFSFRVFNSRDSKAEELLDDLGAELTLKQAFGHADYGRQLREFFAVALACDAEVSSEDVIRRLKSDDHFDIFKYGEPRRPALFAVDIGDSHTDFCGFGFDDRRKYSTKSLAFVRSGQLLEEYARDF